MFADLESFVALDLTIKPNFFDILMKCALRQVIHFRRFGEIFVHFESDFE